ncbi:MULTISPECIES: TlpA disulfide reductase family protein [unclassified Rothia (in: high G+C Gram-positive bacteria)]|uniref:TlpA family protein disulfide reductase n=1 Tax=unclassified Rothia (in: high G+C Gram-positive bacteria) TaxID=2689056 RepID=UPI001957A9BC|nr:MULTISPECIES: TlpA disulfide reductase family protein [unclassified Rothia (in: high G+C Gram-positive bacteria)]MBM7051946.1 TlpA family protein disulfide reductase [Rothia sp. ZJ1223]QRZ61986.1 TlpA family protein disulfide reductase [Rothia sp. ZJ932]
MRYSSIVTRRQGLSLSVAAAAFVLAGCSSSNDDLAAQANAGDDKGYVAGDGSVTEWAVADRSEPVNFTGELFDGGELTAESLRGKPALLNFWYAGCAPCRAEAPHLNDLHKTFGEDIEFWGVNVRDEKGTAEAFERNFEVPYSSMKDLNGKVLLALSKTVPAQAVPTTLLLDAEGRVAARVLGEIDPSIMKTMMQDLLSE